MGILANSPSVTMGSSTSDDSESGFVVGERVVLTTSPVGTTYEWALSVPSGSGAARSALNSTTAAAPQFILGGPGTYVIVCTVDASLTYVLRLDATDPAIVTVAQALRLSPVPDSAVPAPSVGRSLYFSSTQNALCVKDPADDVFTVDVTAV